MPYVAKPPMNRLSTMLAHSAWFHLRVIPPPFPPKSYAAVFRCSRSAYVYTLFSSFTFVIYLHMYVCMSLILCVYVFKCMRK